MTAPTLTVDHATRYAVPCVWQAHDGPTAATLIVSKSDHFGDWCVTVTPDGWATLFLTDDDRDPSWGRWSNYTRNLTAHATAQAALDAAWATPQITPPEADTPADPTLFEEAT